MNLGTFTKKGDDFIGSISTFGGQFPEVVFEATNSQKGPAYIIHANGGELGAAWKKTSAKGNDYMSVSLKGPFLAKTVYAALLESTNSPGTFSLVWNEQEEKKD